LRIVEKSFEYLTRVTCSNFILYHQFSDIQKNLRPEFAD